jgi:hypothetical protein
MLRNDKTINARPFRVGSVLVQRVPASSADYRASHQGYWHGFICPEKFPPQLVERFGKLIEARSSEDLGRERTAYRATLTAEKEIRFAYYEVINDGE